MSRALNVTLRQLRVFIEVARLQSFSRAGDEIGLTQSAVSRCVRELEGEIGLKLVDRTTREVQLTDVGANLVGSVSRLLSDLDEALRYILSHDGVWNTTADDIAEYYIANYYDQVSSWIAERKAQA